MVVNELRHLGEHGAGAKIKSKSDTKVQSSTVRKHKLNTHARAHFQH